MDESKVPTRKGKQVEHLLSLAARQRRNELVQERTEALVTARAIALAGLPKRRTSKRYLTRTLRLGHDLWLRVTYSVGLEDGILPYGQDRFVLAGVQHLALKQRSRAVSFDEVGQLLKMFGVPSSIQSYALLRERFERLQGLSIHLCFARTEEGLKKPAARDFIKIIRAYRLPTRLELQSNGKIAEFEPPSQDPEFELSRQIPELEHLRHGVLLDLEFWKHLQQTKEHLIVPMDLMRAFVTRPTGWDYAAFLVYRCTRAKTYSIIEHDVLMSLFKDNPRESDNQTIRRLQDYHQEILKGFDGGLDAVLEQVGHFKSSGGRPKERWQLRVGPSKPVVHSGKQQELFSLSES